MFTHASSSSPSVLPVPLPLQITKQQLQQTKDRFQAFLNGDTQIVADEAFINAVQSYYEVSPIAQSIKADSGSAPSAVPLWWAHKKEGLDMFSLFAQNILCGLLQQFTKSINCTINDNKQDNFVGPNI